jgi:SAM-dependent MidA family methyltransferase
MEAALYDPEGGFFASGQGAGRAGGDFITSPEVGSLFGACVARMIDRMWDDLGEPDPFLVVEAGAGNGRLARDVLRAHPRCSPALRYVLVERSAALLARQRELLNVEPVDEALGPFVRQRNDDDLLPQAAAGPVPQAAAGPVVAALGELPAIEADGAVVLANELLDNLPFGIAHWDGTRWLEVRVGVDDAGDFLEVLVPATDADASELARDAEGTELAPGHRLPIPRALREWFRECDGVLQRGYVLLIDYFLHVAEIARRDPPGGWLRTYRNQQRGSEPLDFPGTQDITGDVVIEQLRRIADFDELHVTSQAEWLRDAGIDDLVEEGTRVWTERAHVGDLEAVAGRSRSVEAAALCDPDALGAHRVFLLGRRVTGRTRSASR